MVFADSEKVFSFTGKGIRLKGNHLDYSAPATMTGFEEVKNLIFSMNLDIQPELTLNVRKVNGNASITAYNFNTFKMPSLEEISSTFTLFTAAGIQTVDLPVLKTDRSSNT